MYDDIAAFVLKHENSTSEHMSEVLLFIYYRPSFALMISQTASLQFM